MLQFQLTLGQNLPKVLVTVLPIALSGLLMIVSPIEDLIGWIL